MKRFQLAFRILSILLFGLPTLFAGSLMAQTNAPAAPAAATATLTVHVNGIRNATGKIHLALFRDSIAVDKRDLDIAPKTHSAAVVFEKIPQGTYAVYLIHDENMNGKLDMDEMGMPLEGYGMSNNPPRREGKPGFDETNFKVANPEVSIEINMIYWQ